MCKLECLAHEVERLKKKVQELSEAKDAESFQRFMAGTAAGVAEARCANATARALTAEAECKRLSDRAINAEGKAEELRQQTSRLADDFAEQSRCLAETRKKLNIAQQNADISARAVEKERGDLSARELRPSDKDIADLRYLVDSLEKKLNAMSDKQPRRVISRF